jgi:hypothetical protein
VQDGRVEGRDLFVDDEGLIFSAGANVEGDELLGIALQCQPDVWW